MSAPWQAKDLGDAGEWLSGGTPSKAKPELWSGDIPWVSPKDMKVLRLGDAIDHVSEAAIGNGTRLLPEGTILMVVRGMILAHTFPVALTTHPVAFNQDIKALRVGEGLDTQFVFYWLQSESSRILRLTDVSNHGTRRLPTERLFSTRIPLPPLPEQRKIAAILTAVDETIERTTAVIEQLEVVKKAMMQELLTRGLPGRHTRFKKTELGEIPEEWEVAAAGSVLASIDAGWSPKCDQRPARNGEWGVLKVSSVSSGVYKSSENKALPSGLSPRPQLEVEIGDVLLARASGALTLVGRTCLVQETPPRLMLSDKTMRLTPEPSRLLGPFLHALMSFDNVRQQVLDLATGSHMRNISQSAIRSVLLPVPPIEEQRKIQNALSSAGARIRAEQRVAADARTLKSSLMSGLLTGEVRVTPDEDGT